MKSLLLCALMFAAVSRGEEAKKTESGQPASKAAATEVVNVDAAAAKKLLDENAAAAKAGKDQKIAIIDVRTQKEYDQAHLSGAKLIDIQGDTFAAELAKLDKTQTCFVHCRSGGRSTTSLETFKKLGFKKVIHLDGGITAWMKAGYPVEEKK